MGIDEVGALLFGFVVGWVTYRTLARSVQTAQISDLATVIGAVGGGVVVSLFDNDRFFGFYSIGLFVGFVLYLVIFFAVNGKKKGATIMGDGEDTIRIADD
jgi:hypothetical protein